jgi:hypothetical protein
MREVRPSSSEKDAYREYLATNQGGRCTHAEIQTDPHWKDFILFYEYFHADNGAGLGASRQTGWTGLVAGLIDLFGRPNRSQYLATGKAAVFARQQSIGEKKVA